MRSRKNIYIQVIVFALAFAFFPKTWGQTTRGGTADDYYNSTNKDKSIAFKQQTKWHDLRNMDGLKPTRNDKFDNDTKTFTLTKDGQSGSIQASHLFIDTIYVHEGTTLQLTLPDRASGGSNSIQSYRRWYNMRTGKTFRLQEDLSTDEDYIIDLLYPTGSVENSDYNKPRRFSNGYIFQPMITSEHLSINFYYPTTEQYNKFPGDLNINPDNKEYLIACDVSGYTDYTDNFAIDTSAKSIFGQNGTYHEPTLSHRIIYCVRAIENENDWRNKFFTEQKSVTDPAKQRYLEEYEINMPFTRIPDKTLEMVSIASAPNAYAVPETKDNDKNNTLTVTLEDGDSNTAGIKLCNSNGEVQSSLSLNKNNRIIHFKYPIENTTDGIETVNTDGSTATILVTKTANGTIYRIARFKLTFKANSTLLTQSQIEQIDGGIVESGKPWAEFTYRTPKYLEEHYTFVTGMDFDFDPAIADKYGQPQVYPYPIGWQESSYAFYDGSAISPEGDQKDFLAASDKSNKKRLPQWGYYAILNDYTENSNDEKQWGLDIQIPAPKNKLLNRQNKESTYHMYIDASDQPGIIARLKFSNKLCPGSELFVSAWVKVAKPYDPTSSGDNAAMLFTIMGVNNADKEKDIRYTPIYRHQTGQIPGTYTEETPPSIPGFGNDNQWLHVYFSFVNKSATNINYDSYVLQIDNNSASTAGGDMYVDDIRVYIAPVEVQVKSKTTTCNAENTGDTPALLQMRLDWDRLLSRTGIAEQETVPSDTDAKAHISFCFVDSAAYISEYDKIVDKTKEDACKEAFRKSIITLAYPTDADDKTQMTSFYEFGKLLFSPHYESNTEYQTDKTNIQALTDAKDAGHFYHLTDDQGRSVAADIYCKLKPFRTYFMVMEENHDSEDHGGDDGSYTPDIDRFKYYYMEPKTENSCVAKTSFRIESQNSIKVNGILSEDSNPEFCAGQIVNFGVQLRADTNGSGELKPVTKEVYYDWFLGSLEAFQQDRSGVNIHQALIDFRNECPDGTAPDDWNTIDKTAEKTLLTGQTEKGNLIVRQAKLNTSVVGNNGDTFSLVVLPIPVKVGASESKETPENDITICSDPLEIQLRISGNAPAAQVGFDDVVYPDEKPTTPDKTYRPVIRSALKGLSACIADDAMLEVPLRGITSSDKTPETGSGSTTGSTSATSFTQSPTHPHLYLIDSNDPVVLKAIADVNSKGVFDNTTWPVATINAISATPAAPGTVPVITDRYLRFHFGIDPVVSAEGLPTFALREGYRYTLLAYFEENKPGNTCEGNLTFDLKVVPEYQKWTGPADGSGNWNNDDNWLRSTADELHMTDTDAAVYNTGYDTSGETYYGFVPTDFTKVTIPEGAQVQLYKASANTAPVGSSDHPILDLATGGKPATITNPATTHIEYDLMVKKATTNGNSVAYNCETYYTNTVDQIHFEPSTAMPHAELLTYQKAWIDYKLAGSRWYTLASPLQSVVAGDWYTPKTGCQTTEYFKDITFNTTDYSRFKPSVYQRAWKQQANMITIGSDGSGNGNTASPTVAVSGNWSGVYNDATVPYTPGLGFSVKVLNLSTTTTPATDPAVALFRFPKADTQYSYYKNDNTTTDSPVNVRTTDEEKKKAGKLKSDVLKSESEVITVTLGANTADTNTNYHLIGNPFIAYLDASKFFGTNKNLESKYWQVTGDNQTVAVGGTDGNDWITSIGTATIAPLQSFFVEKAETSTYADNNTVTFSADMQVLAPTATTSPTASSVVLKSSSSLPLLTLVATTGDGRQSRAVIAYDRTSSEEYKAYEDAELFLDSNLGDLPAIYTVAGTMAASINRTSNLWNIPIGTYYGINGNNNETVTLSFEGLDRFTGTTLYDAVKKNETPLHDNGSITIAANTYGRYFLRAGTPTGNEMIETETIRIYTIPHGQLIVTATEHLQTVAIYDFTGRLLRYADTLPDRLFTTYLGKGNYIVRATSEHQQQTSKIQIR